MANPVNFPGANFTFKAPPGSENVRDLHVFRQPHGVANVSCWELSARELDEINRTGRIFLSVLSGDIFYPVFVGSESDTRLVVAAEGDTWENRDG